MSNCITIENYKFTANATFSRLLFDGEFVCYLLQDTLRPYGVKVHGETGIPVSTGFIKLGNSAKFGTVPFIYNDPDCETYEAKGISFKFLRIHVGNYIKDTHGCPLTGTTVDYDKQCVYNSRKALNKLMTFIKPGIEYNLEVKNIIE